MTTKNRGNTTPVAARAPAPSPASQIASIMLLADWTTVAIIIGMAIAINAFFGFPRRVFTSSVSTI